MSKSLLEIHEDVPAEHYDIGIKRNWFQKYWHWRRFSEVIKVIRPVEGPILDIGCHGGTFTSKILPVLKTKKIYGIDVSPSAINLARKRIPLGHFQVADAAQLPFSNDFFDAVFTLEVLEHIDNPTQALREIHRVLKKEGYGLLLVPTDNKLFKIIWFLWTFYYPHWRHTHVQSYRDENLEKLVMEAGFRIILVKKFNLGMLKIIIIKK